MSLYEVRDRAERVVSWLKEDSGIILSLYEMIEKTMSMNPDAHSSGEHDSNMKRMGDITRKYATLVDLVAETNIKLEELKNIQKELRTAVNDGYIEISSSGD